MMTRLRRTESSRGFTLVEVVIVLVIAAILGTVALRAGRQISDTARLEETKQEMESIARGITGNPDLTNNGMRADYGYVGDIGALPPNLAALVTNPGYATWKGPYVRNRFAQVASDYASDAWGTSYVYSGLAVVSSGSGITISRNLAPSSADLLRNDVAGTITDADGTPPGSVFDDSLFVQLVYPNGAGGYRTETIHPTPDGSFAFDSIPIGTHALTVIYTPTDDTLKRFLSIGPNHQLRANVSFAENLWATGLVSSGGGSGNTVTLRPSGEGFWTQLTGCSSANWQCVADVTPDEDATFAERAANTWAMDVYQLPNPTAQASPPTNVTVYVRCKREHTQGQCRPAIRVNGSVYTGTAVTLTSSWADYSHVWSSNPSTSAAWTWAEINSLEAGVDLVGQNSNFSASCTQVWVEVQY